MFVILAIIVVYLMFYKPLLALYKVFIKMLKKIKKDLEEDDNDR
jgi:hypothetical protein